ncbi:MAG TPA: glycosyltransferase family 39 protein, partial [Phycisphaerae bacterium]
GDEAFVAVNFVTRDFAGMIKPLEYGQIVPLGYMWAELAVSRMLGLSEWSLHLVAFVAGIIALLVFWRFAFAVLDRRAALLALAFFAASYYPVRHAAEVKAYATDLLIGLVLSASAWSVYQRPRSISRWIVLVLLGAAAPWCSYPSVFVLGAIGLLLVLLAMHERFAARLTLATALYGLVVIGSFLAMYIIYARPHAQAASLLTETWARAFPPLTAPLKLFVWFLAVHTGNMLAYPQGGQPPGSIITALLVVIGAVRLWHTRRELLLLLLGPLPFALIAAGLKAYPYGDSARTSLYLAPAFCLLAGLGLWVLLQRFLKGQWRRAGLRVAAIVFCLFAVGGMAIDLLQPYKSGPVARSRAAVKTLVDSTGPQDRWVIFNATVPVPYAPWLGDWHGIGAQFVFDVLRFARVPVQWAPPPESIQPQPGAKLWLMAYSGCKVGFPDDQWAAYLATIRARFAPPVRHTFEIKRKGDCIEALTVYEFPPP